MTFPQLLLANAGLIATSLISLWIVSLVVRDASIIDMFWGAGFVLISWLSLFLTPEPSSRAVLLTVLVSGWGLRLSGYLTWRNWGEPEDRRYQKMRDKHGSRFPVVSLLTVFLLQGVLMWIVSLPVQSGIAAASGWPVVAGIGVVLWSVGLFFETVGDYQMARFKSDPDNRGKVMDHGLWRYTRHPNYFGDFTVWWGLYLVSWEPHCWWTVVGPLVMSVLLLRFSGVTLLEGDLSGRKDGYAQYKQRTSVFFPLPPKNADHALR